MTTRYRRWPKTTPSGAYIAVAIERQDDGTQFATLETVQVPQLVSDGEFAVTRALGRALAFGDQSHAPVYVRLGDGAAWNPAWGMLVD